MPARRVTLMHNPMAGDGKHRAAELVELFRRAGMKVTYQSTKVDHYAAALKKPCDFVVAAGGDGTVRKVCKRLVGSDVPVAVLPLGSANNIAQSLGVHGDLRKLVSGLAAPRVKAIDVGVARGPWGKTIFFEAIGTGLFPDAVASLGTNPRRKHKTPEARLKHLLRAMRKCLPGYATECVRATLDDVDISGSYLLVEAMNISLVGPNLFAAPHADPSDGLLEVVVLTEPKRGPFESYLKDRIRGGHSVPDLDTYRGKRLRFVWHGNTLHLDSKLWPKHAERRSSGGVPLELVDVTLKRHALQLMLAR